MSQAELADAIGISPRTLGKYEADKVEPKRPVVLSWALATGVPVEWLLYGVIPTNGPEGPEGHESSGNDVLNVTRTAEVVELHRAARAA